MLPQQPTAQSGILEIDGRSVGYTEYCSSTDGTSSSDLVAKQKLPCVVMLHGWGASRQVFERSAVGLAKVAGARVITVDFPGFGESAPPLVTWNTSHFVDFLFQFLDALNIEAVDLCIGHSHGGRVTLAAAARTPGRFKKLLLVGGAGIKRPLSVRKRMKVLLFKSLRHGIEMALPKGKIRERFLDKLRSVFGSGDYRAAGVMRSTLVAVLNEDLTSILPRIVHPTLLVWGDRDDDTPLYMGQKMKKLIPDAGLVVWEGAGHYAFLDRPDQFESVAAHFLLHP
ncbi:MAG: alpha/beta hydrolase [Bdellovibrionales bacterium]|nr:alpha/beta hydrolase [Bdellovibrionales bacterium]